MTIVVICMLVVDNNVINSLKVYLTNDKDGDEDEDNWQNVRHLYMRPGRSKGARETRPRKRWPHGQTS